MAGMTVTFGVIVDLQHLMVRIHEITDNVLDITLKGHPTECMNGAHRLGADAFKGPWHFTKIQPRFIGPWDRAWEFRIRMEHKT